MTKSAVAHAVVYFLDEMALISHAVLSIIRSATEKKKRRNCLLPIRWKDAELAMNAKTFSPCSNRTLKRDNHCWCLYLSLSGQGVDTGGCGCNGVGQCAQGWDRDFHQIAILQPDIGRHPHPDADRRPRRDDVSGLNGNAHGCGLDERRDVEDEFRRVLRLPDLPVHLCGKV